jgi:tripartite-type tricarboxylate transporter receptor subunit TctC
MKTGFSWLSTLMALLLSTAVLAQNNNAPPLKLIVGYAAGGPVDGAARLLAPYLSRALDGQTVLVDNRPGAAGALGGDVVAKSAGNVPQLYFAASPTLTITPHLLRAMPFDPVRELTPIAPLVSYANVLVLNKDAPFKTLPELLAYAKSNPGKISYGSAGVGASNHLSGELLALRTGTDLTHVPYKGNAPAMTDVMGGQISMMFDIINSARSHIASGAVRPIAVTSSARNNALPTIPTMRESGVPDYDVAGWFAVFASPKIAAADAARYTEAFRKVLANDEVKAKLIDGGYDVWTGTPSMVADRLAKELALWGVVTKNIPKQ